MRDSPTYFATARLGTIYQTGSLVLAIILNATVTLCTLFVPKMYYLFFIKQTDSQPDTMTSLKHVDKSTSFPTFTSLPLPTHSVTSAPQNTSQAAQEVPVLTTENKSYGKLAHTENHTESAGTDGLQVSGDTFQKYTDASTQTHSII